MNLYKISQTINGGYDTFSSAIVAAPTKDRAKVIHPTGLIWNEASKADRLDDEGNPRDGWEYGSPHSYPDWANDPSEVRVRLIGTACDGTVEGVILASFHAG